MGFELTGLMLGSPLPDPDMSEPEVPSKEFLEHCESNGPLRLSQDPRQLGLVTYLTMYFPSK